MEKQRFRPEIVEALIAAVQKVFKKV